MSFRARLLILLVLMSLLTNGALFALMYVGFQNILFEEIRQHSLSIASTAGALIDGDLQKNIRARSDEESADYRVMRELMRRARDANRRQDRVHVEYIYTTRQSPKKAELEFVVDPEESPEKVSHVGDKFETDEPPIPYLIDLLNGGGRYVDPTFTKDKFGTFLTAYAPLRNNSGKVVGQLGVDVRQDHVLQKIGRVFQQGLIALAAAVALAVAVALVLSARVSRPLVSLKKTVERIEKGDLNARTDIKSKDEFGVLANAVNSMGEVLALRSALARYVSQEVMDNIVETRQPPSLKGDRREITVLFSDIRGFTTLSEQMEPEEVVGFLDEYFERMVGAVFGNRGALDKFLGDGIMALFGAPMEDSDHRKHAILTALKMQEDLRSLCQKWETEGKIKIRIGIGINTGFAVVGNIGAPQRLDYTAIGDTVNLASRLETATKEVGADILVSESTYAGVRDDFRFRPVGSIQVKGHVAPVATYAVETNHRETTSDQ